MSDESQTRRIIREELAAERREREREEKDAERDRELAELRDTVGKLGAKKRDDDGGDDHEPEV